MFTLPPTPTPPVTTNAPVIVLVDCELEVMDSTEVAAIVLATLIHAPLAEL